LGIVPIQESHNGYAKRLSRELTAQGLRVSVDSGSDNMRSKIKRFQLEKMPYILVVGDREASSGSFAVRSRKDGDLGSMDIPRLMEYLKPQMEQGNPKCILEEE
jgi:threonyl-tRNA synthetase